MVAHDSSFRLVIITFAPADAIAAAMPRPIPREPPVTMATLPSSLMSMDGDPRGTPSAYPKRERRGSRQLIGSADPAVVTLPIGFTEDALEDLAGRVAGDLLDELDRLRALEAGQVLAGVEEDVISGHP